MSKESPWTLEKFLRVYGNGNSSNSDGLEQGGNLEFLQNIQKRFKKITLDEYSFWAVYYFVLNIEGEKAEIFRLLTNGKGAPDTHCSKQLGGRQGEHLDGRILKAGRGKFRSSQRDRSRFLDLTKRNR